MEQSSAQNRMSGLPHAGAANGSSPQFWNHNLEAMYADQQLQQPQGQQAQGASLQQPLGIGWDHPALQQHPQQPQMQQQQRTTISHSTDPNVNLYTQIPQSWQPNPLQPAGRSYVPPSQFQAAQPISNYPQGQMRFESRPLHASESSAFPSYSFPNPYFSHQPQPPSIQDAYQEQPPQQHSQPTELQTSPPEAQYNLPTGYSSELLGTIDLNNFSSESGHHQTIDPHFLNPTGQSAQQNTMPPRNYVYQNQPALGEMFDYYQNDISVQPQLGVGSNQVQPPAIETLSPLTGLPVPQVVIATKKPAKKQSTKKAKPQKKAKDGSVTASSDESDLEIEAPPEVSPIPPARPTDPIAAAEYDTLQAVWSPRNKRVSADKVKSGLMQFKDIVKALRDSWKDKTQEMKLAENNGDDAKALKLKENVVLQRQTMNKIMTTAMETGHPMIVEKCGEHPMAVAAIYSFMADRFQAADYDGALTLNMLKLLARFVTVDEDMLQKTNLTKLLPRLIKKGGQTTKDFGNKILDNAAASSKRKQDGPKATRDDSPALKNSSDSSSAELAGSKRPRDGDGHVQPATKRSMVVTSNPKDTSKQAATTNGTIKRTADVAGKSSVAAAPRPKPTITAPKPANLFSTLSSASKRPGTTNAERAAAAAAAAEKKEKPAAPPPKPAFSFGDIMADLSKPKVTVVAKPAEDKPPETEEERQKRLRKEERRKLRVKWKPDEALTEVRLFTHDPDEELNPGDSSLRGVGDVKGEGSVLKLHKDMDELEEDDFGGPRETSFGDYHALSEIAFNLPEELRNNNFIKRGGKQLPVSLEKEAQDQREATTLMPFYSSPAEVPSTPKEPPTPDANEIVPDVVTFGSLPDQIKVWDSTPSIPSTRSTPSPTLPSVLSALSASVPPATPAIPATPGLPAFLAFPVLHAPLYPFTSNVLTPQLQSRQERYFDAMRPKPAPVPTPAHSQPQAPANQPAGGFADFANLLKLMNPGAQQQSTPPQIPQPPAPAPMTDLERTINMFRQQQAPPVPQAPIPQPPAPVDFEGILNVMKQLQGGGFPQPQQQQPQPAMPVVPNFGNMFAPFGGQNQYSNGQNHGQTQYSNGQNHGQNQYPTGSNHGQSVNDYEDPERKRMRESDYGDYSDSQYESSWSRSKRTRANDARPFKYGLVPCKFWAEGKCRKGENCTYRHDSQ